MEKNFYWLSEEALLDYAKKYAIEALEVMECYEPASSTVLSLVSPPPLPAPIQIPTDEEIQKEAIKHAENVWGDFSNDITDYGTGMTNGDISEKDFLAGYRYLKEKIKQ